MGYHDVAFLPSELGFRPHFLNIVVEVNVMELPHLITVVGGKHGNAHCKIFSP